MQSIIEQYTAKTGESVGVSAKSMVEAVQNNQIEAVATERPFLQHIFTQAESLSQVIVALDWQILIAPFGTGFMLSDSPVVVVPPRGVNAVGFAVPGAVKYFPMTYGYCLRLGDAGVSFEHRRISKDTLRIIIGRHHAHYSCTGFCVYLRNHRAERRQPVELDAYEVGQILERLASCPPS